MDRPPFDPVRFACWLVATILGVQCVAVLVAVGMCVYHDASSAIGVECDPKDRLAVLLTGALSAALALLAGFKSGDKK